jgi:hypothetical protein
LARLLRGTSKRALVAYQDGIVGVLLNVREALWPVAPVAIVVNDRRDLYPEILERAGLALEERLRRHVNRRTGRRAGEYFEDVLVARVWRQELGAGNGLRPRVARVSADVPGNVTRASTARSNRTGTRPAA